MKVISLEDFKIQTNEQVQLMFLEDFKIQTKEQVELKNKAVI